jgi:hypothetical protein
VLTIHQDEIEREQNRYLFRTKTDNKSIAMEHQKSDDDETENSKHGTEHDNATPREKKELSLSLSDDSFLPLVTGKIVYLYIAPRID